MNIKPVNEMVYIKVEEAKEKVSDGGIVMVTDEEIVPYKTAEVLAIPEGSEKVKAKVGDTVLISPQIQALVIDEEKREFLIRWEQIYGIVS